MIRFLQLPFSKEQRPMIDNLYNYVNFIIPAEQYVEGDLGYIKNGLNITVVAPFPQTFNSKNNFNYVLVQNEDERQFYYWIVDASWTSKETIRFVLELDTVNTFKDVIDWNARTLVKRQHKDRFEKSDQISQGSWLRRRIDTTYEGLDIPKFKTNDAKVLEPAYQAYPGNWYLVYQTNEDPFVEGKAPVPVNTYAVFDKAWKVETQQLTVKKPYYFISPDKTYALCTALGSAIGDTITYRNTGDDEDTTFSITESKAITIQRIPDTNSLKIFEWTKASNGQWNSATQRTTEPNSSVAFKTGSKLYYVDGMKSLNDIVSQSNVPFLTIDLSTIAFLDLDRSNSRILKIIQLPYEPFGFTIQGGNLVLPDGFIIENGMVKIPTNFAYDEREIATKSLPLRYQLTNTPADRALEVRVRPNYDDIEPSDEFITQLYRESKLLNSNFYTLKYVYDNNFKEIPLEKFKRTNTENLPSTTIKFKMTSTYNSVFGFHFVYNNAEPYEQEDFENYLVIKRSNEMPIYNSEYINYMRTGYNYDSETTGRQIASAWLGTGTNIGNTLIAQSGLSGLASKTSAGGVAGAALSIISGVATQAMNTQNAYAALDQKKRELSMQSVSVSGSDDVDMLDWYSSNVLRVITYEPEWRVQAALSDLFFYTGYACNEMRVPDISSRYWFNFIQCDAVFNANVSTEFLNVYADDIRAKFAEGVTVYHYRSQGWNTLQDRENYETWLVQV